MLKKRQTSIDYMKAALVIGMIVAHSLQLLSHPRGLFWVFSLVINLITFSGFIFCFGYVFYFSYFTKPLQTVWRKLVKTAGKTLAGYYISGTASLLLLTPLLTHKPYIFSNFWRFLLMVETAVYSEFLLAFFVITGLALVLFKPFQFLLNNPAVTAAVCLICLMVSLVLPEKMVVNPVFALFIGTSGTQVVFPIIQYLPFFLAGLYVSKYKFGVNRYAWVAGCAGTALLVSYFLLNHEPPSRFPPSIYWLLGSTGILYGYFLAARWLEHRSVTIPFLLTIGRNSLFYLIVSNLIIFSIAGVLQTNPAIAFAIGLLIIGIISFLLGLITQAPAQPEKETSQLAENPYSGKSA